MYEFPFDMAKKACEPLDQERIWEIGRIQTDSVNRGWVAGAWVILRTWAGVSVPCRHAVRRKHDV